MSLAMGHILLHFLALVGCAFSYPSGATKGACRDMIPGHGSVAQFQAENGDFRYDIFSELHVILPADSTAIRVWDRHNLGKIKGLLTQVRRSDTDDITGVWSVINPASVGNIKTMECSNDNDAVTQSNARWKNDTQTEAVWTAPATCVKNEKFEIRATILQSKDRWHMAKVPLVCDPDYDDTEVMERVRPPLKSQYCARRSWAIIPKKASESFEEPLGNRGNWRHFFGAEGLKFVRKSGSTPTDGTGQISVPNGNYYLSYEINGTRKNDMAGLYSPFGIQGCFCFSFFYHMNTDGETEFTLSAIGVAQRLIMKSREVANDWRRIVYTVTSEKPVLFAFQVYSSGSDNGDIGLDNIEVTPGPCDVAIGSTDFINL